MRKTLLGSALSLGLFLTAAPALAQQGCTREELLQATDGYLQAQAKGDPTLVPLSGWTQYNEQFEMGTMSTGILSKPQKIDFHRTIVDTQACQTFTEIVITDPAHPYVLGVALTARGGRVSAIDTLVTDADDWLFNAANTLKYSKAEKWTEIPAAERDSRETIIAAADAYLNLFSDKTVQVPWGSPCARLEGGLYTAKGAPGEVRADDTCNVGVPSDTRLVERRYIVDESLGAVSVLLVFGKNQLPDVHTFRIEKGKLRYVHTITVCKTFNCGFPLPEQLKTAAK